MLGFFNKPHGPRRSAAREARHDFETRTSPGDLPRHDLVPSLLIAAGFWLAVTLMFLFRKDVVTYRPGEYLPHDIFARTDFKFFDQALHDERVKFFRESAPRAYHRLDGDPWSKIQDYLLALPDTVQGLSPQELNPPLNTILDSGSVTELEQDRTGADRQQYETDIRQFIAYAQRHIVPDDQPLVIISQADRDEENRLAREFAQDVRRVKLLPPASDQSNPQTTAAPQTRDVFIDIANVYGTQLPDSFEMRLEEAARGLGLGLGPKIARITVAVLTANPNYQYDDQATHDLKNDAEKSVSDADALEMFVRGEKIVTGGTTLSERDFLLLEYENTAYQQNLTADPLRYWENRLGLCLARRF